MDHLFLATLLVFAYLIYQAGETWFLGDFRNPVFPSLNMMVLNFMKKTGFLSETRSRDKPSLSWRIRLLRVDSFAQETRFLSISVFGYLFTNMVKPGFGDIPETRFFHIIQVNLSLEINLTVAQKFHQLLTSVHQLS
jgi:hypothetical protein